MYQPGEVVHYRSLTLDRFSLKPANEDLRLTYELVTPTRGRQTLAQAANGLRRSRRKGQPPTAAVGGPGERAGRQADPRRRRRRLRARPAPGRAASTRSSAATRTTASRNSAASSSSITIRSRSSNKELDFNRTTYGPGDEVAARCKAVRANGDPVRNQPVEATVLIDDKTYDADGTETNQPLRLPDGRPGRGRGALQAAAGDRARRGVAGREVPRRGRGDDHPAAADRAEEAERRVLPRGRRPGGRPAEPRLLPGAHAAGQAGRPQGPAVRGRPAAAGRGRDAARRQGTRRQPGHGPLRVHAEGRQEVRTADRLPGRHRRTASHCRK